MNPEKYRQVLITAMPSDKHLTGNGFIFQHDYNHKHIANAAESYLKRKTDDNTRVLSWHTQNPDLGAFILGQSVGLCYSRLGRACREVLYLCLVCFSVQT